MQKIKKGDTVLIVKNKDRGKKGKVIKVIPKDSRIIVEGVNLVKKHLKPKTAAEKGKIIEIPAPLSWSNVRVICPSCSRPTKIGFRLENEKKVRYCKKCKKSL